MLLAAGHEQNDNDIYIRQQSESSTLLPSTKNTKPHVLPSCRGSSIQGAALNFTNSIIGAGCIGLGSAMARSGGLISIITIACFAILTKLSFDLVISLSITDSDSTVATGSYEHLGYLTYGTPGRVAVMLSKFLYSFGCLVAYLKIVKDTFSSAMCDLTTCTLEWNVDLVTFVISAIIVLPLCLLRNVTLLEHVSFIKITVVVSILLIIIYLHVANPGGAVRIKGGSVTTNWCEVRSGYIQSLGTFVFTFVAQHTVNLAYESLRPELKTLQHWKCVSTLSVLISAALSLGIATTVYITFWEHTTSVIFELYPPLPAVSIAKLLLCFMMMLTYPLPFFSCRQILILQLPGPNDNVHVTDQRLKRWWLLEGQGQQLITALHVAVTVTLWGMTTLLAILAPSLSDILDLVGCATGTVIAFVLPALFAFKLQGYSHLAALILLIGGVVGLVGTYLTLRNLLLDKLT